MTKEQIIEELHKLKAVPETQVSPDGTELFVKLGKRWDTVTNIRRILADEPEYLMDDLVDNGVPLAWVFCHYGERMDVPDGALMDSELPDSYPVKYLFKGENSVSVELRRGRDEVDRWAVLRGAGSCLDKYGDWGYESMPSSRTEGFIERTRFTLEEALRLGAEEALRQNQESLACQTSTQTNVGQ